MIAWDKITKEDIKLITHIQKRAYSIWPDINVMTLNMDLTACQVGDTPLDLEKLLAFDDFNFSHDIGGITQHIDRETGKLMDRFSPRCTLR